MKILLVAGYARSDKESDAIDNNVPSSNNGSVDKVIEQTSSVKNYGSYVRKKIDAIDLKWPLLTSLQIHILIVI